MGALIISRRLFGFTPNALKKVEPEYTFDATAVTRLKVFDSIIEKYAYELEQVVLPGVGFDLTALSYSRNYKTKVFELDQVDTLNVKVETLKKACIEHDTVSYIPLDYENESWTEKLVESGFNKTKKTLFLWQSISLFQDAEILENSLKKMADLCGREHYCTGFLFQCIRIR